MRSGHTPRVQALQSDTGPGGRLLSPRPCEVRGGSGTRPCFRGVRTAAPSPAGGARTRLPGPPWTTTALTACLFPHDTALSLAFDYIFC